MDSYQPIYDAVRSRIGGIDVGSAVESALREANLSHYAEMAMHSAFEVAGQHQRPSVLYRPSLGLDGTMWRALYGENLMDGVAGFGETPAKAMEDFDKNWFSALTPAAARQSEAPA